MPAAALQVRQSRAAPWCDDCVDLLLALLLALPPLLVVIFLRLLLGVLQLAPAVPLQLARLPAAWAEPQERAAPLPRPALQRLGALALLQGAQRQVPRQLA